MQKKIHIFLYITIMILFGCSENQILEREFFPLPEDVKIIKDIEPGTYTDNLIMAEDQPPKTFNPLIIEDNYSRAAVMPLLSSLIDYDPVNQVFTPGLAKSWTISEDKLKYSFNLRKGIKWNDGQNFTADDIIFTFDAIFDERYPNRTKIDLTIDGNPIKYSKINDYTVEFYTSKPYAPFINDIGGISILPKHKLYEPYKNGKLQQAWTLETAINTPNEIVGTGPYCIAKFQPAERIVYRPNPHYWKADIQGTRLPYIDTLIYTYVTDNNTELVLFSTGQTDAAVIPARDLIWVSKASKKYNFSIYEQGPSNNIGVIWFNEKPGKNEKNEYYIEPYKLKWFQDKRFRQAILHAIDRKGIIHSSLLGHGQLLNSIISPANKKWYNPNVRKYPFNPEKTTKLLTDIGFKKNKKGLFVDEEGHLLEFSFLVNDSGDTSMITGIQENLKDVGITMNLIFMDFATMIDKIGKTFRYESSILGFGSRGADTGDPSGIKAIIRSSGTFHLWNPEQKKPATSWEAEVDSLFDLQEKEMNEKKRIVLIQKIQEIFSEELPLLYLITPDVLVGIKNGWHNIKRAPMSSVFWNIDELWKENYN